MATLLFLLFTSCIFLSLYLAFQFGRKIGINEVNKDISFLVAEMREGLKGESCVDRKS